MTGQVNTCGSGAVVGAGFVSIPEDLQSGVAIDAIFAAGVAVGCAVDLKERDR